MNPAYERLGELSVALEDLKRFRQLDARCPGHPEYRWTSGVETATGPLGQGVAAEAASLAGHLKLSNLCWVYDNNRITIEGNTSLAFSEDVAMRFVAYN